MKHGTEQAFVGFFSLEAQREFAELRAGPIDPTVAEK